MAHASRAPVPLCRARRLPGRARQPQPHHDLGPDRSRPSQLGPASVQPAQTPPGTPDIGKAYVAPRAGDDYERREVMIPMRDGVKLFTVIVVPKGASRAPRSS